MRVELPPHLRRLAGTPRQVELTVPEPATLAAVLGALEARHPELVGTIRPPGGHRRRPLMRFFAAGRDLSHEPLDAPLPPQVAGGSKVLRVVGAIAGG
ncbi:MAG: MoaD/ThiS family protein [bacterium]